MSNPQGRWLVPICFFEALNLDNFSLYSVLEYRNWEERNNSRESVTSTANLVIGLSAQKYTYIQPVISSSCSLYFNAPHTIRGIIQAKACRSCSPIYTICLPADNLNR